VLILVKLRRDISNILMKLKEFVTKSDRVYIFDVHHIVRSEGRINFEEILIN
jgi:hypothetical protein